MKLGWENEKSIGGYDGGNVGDGVGWGQELGMDWGGVGGVGGLLVSLGRDESWEWKEVWEWGD